MNTHADVCGPIASVIETDISNTAGVPMSGIAGTHATLPLMVLTMRVRMNRARAFSLVGALLWAGCSAPIRRTDPPPGPIPAPSALPAAAVASAMPPAGPPDAAALRSEPEPGGADLDPTNDGVVAPPDPIADCETLLERAGVKTVPSSLPVHRERSGRITCGAEQVVVYQAGPEAIRYNPAPVVTCGLALAIARLEAIVQEEARARFGKRVVRIDHGGTYTCRRMKRFRHMVSEHSYANAIDIRAFTLEDGRRITVLAHFGSTDSEPAAPESQFLRAVARRLYDEAVFSVVLTSFWDAGHRDHFHLDMAHYRVDGTR
jgi:hypothetical protein